MSDKSILDMIRERRGMTREQIEELKRGDKFKRAPVSKDDWQTFKKNFVEEYGGEKVQSTGMTHSEFLQYLKDGTREGVDPVRSDIKTLKDFLDKL